jgi:hypothetical protein
MPAGFVRKEIKMYTIDKFPMTRRARIAVKKFFKGALPPIPTPVRCEATKRSWIRRLLRLPEQVEAFELRPGRWNVSEIAVKRGRIYINLSLGQSFRRMSDGAAQYHGWYGYQYRSLPEYGGEFTGPSRVDGVETGISVFPLNAQQASYLEGKPTDAVWGIAADLEELKKAPDGLFCPHILHK